MQRQEKYTLTWHNYSDHLREALQEMMTTSEFADVTLITDDKQQIRAHQNILSACSPVFKSIFQIDSNSTNPVIYLRGIQHSEMESIMQFIYLGEAKFDEERMNEFLKVSKNLEIKDLSTVTEMNDQHDLNEKSSEHEDNVAEVEDVDEVPAQTLNEDVEYQTQTSTTVSKPIIRNKTSTKTEVVSEDANFKCKDCERMFDSQAGLFLHTKSKHEGVKYACNHCDYQATKQSNLIRHIQSIHEGVKYACNQCDYQGSSDGFYRHMKTKHL